MKEKDQLFDIEPFHPGKRLRQMMEERGWTQDDLAIVLGRSRQMVNELLTGKTGITLETAIILAAAFGNTPDEWLKWDSAHKLSVSEADVAAVGRMARLFDLAPIREMQKRGWLAITMDPKELEGQLTKFFGKNPLDEQVSLPVAARRRASIPTLNAAEKAWCFRARQLSPLLPITPFSSRDVDRTAKELRNLAAFPKEIRHVPKVLAECGIKLIVIEPITGCKIDGATIWTDSSPVIVLSLRFDRIDGFWFTLMHEFAHVKNGDASVDVDLIDSGLGISTNLAQDEAEVSANEMAANYLIPRADLDSFIRRVGPMYPRERVVQFAHRVKIHPGIVVGQLQHKEKIGYHALRGLLVKVRGIITSTALTDGWSQTIPQI